MPWHSWGAGTYSECGRSEKSMWNAVLIILCLFSNLTQWFSRLCSLHNFSRRAGFQPGPSGRGINWKDPAIRYYVSSNSSKRQALCWYFFNDDCHRSFGTEDSCFLRVAIEWLANRLVSCDYRVCGWPGTCRWQTISSRGTELVGD